MPDAIQNNNSHLAVITKMRQVRKIWFNTPLEYDTPDSDQEIAWVMCSAISFDEYRPQASSDSEDDDPDEVEDEEEHASDDDDEDLENLPLSVFGLVPNEDDADDETAELEFALWTHFQALEDACTFLRGLWEERTRTKSPSSLALFLMSRGVLVQAIVWQDELEQRFPVLADAGFATFARAVLGHHRGDDRDTSNLMGVLGQMRSFLMIDTWTVCRAFFSGSMTEETVRDSASYICIQPDAEDSLPTEEASVAARSLLMKHLCLWRTRDVRRQTADTLGRGPRWWGPSPITLDMVVEYELTKVAIWLDRTKRSPLNHLRRVAKRITRSIRNWLDTHNPRDYGNAASELALEMRDVIAFANSLFEGERRLILEADPLSRTGEEYALLGRSWTVGQRLISPTSRHRCLATVMSLYVHLRKHNSEPKITAMESLCSLLVPHGGDGRVLRFPEGLKASLTIPRRLSPADLLRWAQAAAKSPDYAVLTLDGFTIERTAFAVLDELNRTCRDLLRPYMRERQPNAPGYVGLISCFVVAWNAGTPQTVRALASRGRAALEHGHRSVSNINPKLTFL